MPLIPTKPKKRGGTGVKGANNVEDDFFTDIFTADTHSTILFFTSRGLVFSTKVYNIPEGTRTSKGRNLVNLLQVPSGEKSKKSLEFQRTLIISFLIFANGKRNC